MTSRKIILNRTVFMAFALFLMAGLSYAREKATAGLSIQAGITVFDESSDTQNSYVQFPFSLKRSQFEFTAVAETNQFKATIYAEIILSDTLGNHLDSASTYYYTYAQNRRETEDGEIKLFNYLSLIIKPGAYKASLNLLDVVSKNKGSFIYDRIEIESPAPGKLRLSSLELAYDIDIVEETEANNSSPLVKNGYRIIPNPMGLFSESDSNLFIYAELYNLDYQADVDDSFLLAFSVYDLDGLLVQDYGQEIIKKQERTSIITNVIDYSAWNPGRYKLKVAANDFSSGQKTEVERPFVVFAKSSQMSDIVATKLISPLDTASLKTKTNWIRFIIEPTDWVMFKTLSEVGKSEFIAQYFNDKDPTPGDNKNQYLDNLLYHFNFSNKHFSSLPELNDGWQSDRGRVLLQNGPCNKIDDAIVPAKSNPLQVWYYYFLEEGVYFVFQDADEFGNYRLVHSNKSGERFDDDWEFWMKNNGIESETSIKQGTNKIPDLILPTGN